eukprot:scaffold14168_cov88-Amphora_coffeaeformis.AAC.1
MGVCKTTTSCKAVTLGFVHYYDGLGAERNCVVPQAVRVELDGMNGWMDGSIDRSLVCAIQ